MHKLLICVQTGTKGSTGYTCYFPMTCEPNGAVKPWVMAQLARKAPGLLRVIERWRWRGQSNNSEVTAHNLIPPKLSKHADCSLFVSI